MAKKSVTNIVTTLQRENEYLRSRLDATQKALNELQSENQYRRIFENTPIGIGIADKEGKLLAYNDAMIKMGNYTRDDMKNVRSVVDLYYDPRERDKLLSLFQQQGSVKNYSIQFKHKDGTPYDALISLVSILFNGQPCLQATVEDVTEHKQVLQSLRESEKKFRTVIEEAVEIVFTVNRDGYFTYVNPIGLAIMGYTIDELKQFRYIDVVEPDYKQLVQRNYIRQFLTKTPISGTEYPARTKSGERKWFNQNARLIIENNEVTGFYIIAREVTDRRKAEEALKESEERFRSLYENSSIGLYRTTPDGKIILANPTIVNLLGFSAFEDLEKYNLEKGGLIDRNTRTLFRKRIEKLGTITGEESIWNRKDGTKVSVRESATVVRDNAGKALYYDGTVEDITDYNLTKDALLLSEIKLRDLFNFAPLGIYQSTPDGRFITVNNSLARMLGYNSPDEMMSLEMSKDIYLIDKQRADIIAQFKKAGNVSNFEIMWKKKNGLPIWIQLDARALKNDDGEPILFNGFVRDISVRKKTEEKQQESEERFRSVTETANEAIITTDAKGVIIEWNKAAEKIFGYKKVEMIGKKLDRVVPPKYVDQHKKGLLRLEKGGKPRLLGKPVELSGLHKKGYEIPIELSLATWETTSGKYYTGILRDISERKQAEELQILFTTAFEATSNGIIITDVKGNIIWVNKAFTTMTGYSLQEVIGKNPNFLKSGEQSDVEYKTLWHTILSGKTWKGELINKRKDGTLYTDEMTINPVRNDSMEITHFVGIKQNITERKRTEEELLERELRFRTVWEKSNDAMRIVNEEGKVILVNDAYCALMGKPREEIEGNMMSIVYQESKQSEVLRKHQERFRSRRIAPFLEREIVLWDGRKKILELSNTFLEIPNQPTLSISVFRDVTDRKRTIEKIEEQAKLLDQARDAIILRDMEHHILFWNKGAEKTYGWTSEEVFGKDAREVLYLDKDRYAQNISELYSKGDLLNEVTHFTKEMKEIKVESRMSLVKDENGKPKSIMSINTDITEKKHLESQLLRTQRMDSLGTLAGGIAHDLNNVLAPVLLAVEVLKRSFPTPASQKIIASVESSAKRGAEIVKQILIFARGAESKKVSVQTRHLIDDIVLVFKQTFPRTITIVNNVPKGTLMILADPTQFHQILMNLGVNARDAMPNGGTLTFSAENIVIDEHYAKMNIQSRPGKFVMFSVNDTGTGMTPEVIDHIYEPFFTTKKIGEGTGLGMSTVHSIIKSHNGFMEIQSEVGKGSTFKIFLPASESVTQEKTESKSMEMLNGNGETILVVDDESSITAVTKQTLELFNYTVLTASHGEEALARYAKQGEKIALVVTDMMMPVMDGHHLIIALRKLNPSIKIIASSGLIDHSDTGEESESRVDGFLHKPYTSDALLETIKEVLQGKA